MKQSTFSWEEPHAKASASLDLEKDWMIRVATSRLPILQLLTNIGPSGWYGRTSPVFCQATAEGILEPSLGGWANSGMGSPTECLTLSTSEFPSDAAVCSLSDVLETGKLPQRYFLSATACRGILRRAGKRGKKLPALLRAALERVAFPELTGRAQGTFKHVSGGGRTSGEINVAACLTAKGQRIDFEVETFSVVHGTQDPCIANQAFALGRNNGAENAVLNHAGVLRVRRLMPVECERLQGFPDGWTQIPYRNKDAADNPRYKAIGNSMAVPVMRWIGNRIKMVSELIDGDYNG